MADNTLLTRAQQLWLHTATTPGPFPLGGETHIVVAPDSRLGPSGWIGIVHLAGATLITAPSPQLAQALPPNLPATAWTDLAHLRRLLPVDSAMGPATLAYRDTPPPPPDPTTTPTATEVEHLDPTHPALIALLASVLPEEAEESGLANITSPAFVLRHEDRIIAAAGYRHWPEQTAHLSVLTAPTHRNLGLARQVAHAATSHSTTHALLTQWRARDTHHHSLRTARSLGFTPLGTQLNIHLALQPHPLSDDPYAQNSKPCS
ncbi:GNAT family N-acetyltransferase [Actinokineospora guangxiensis]|uniref:GNAT family N-acetyltransferase n=1 Tax=Actinokineospora guangxiensis TaxID=1490288 RepID=A0ABW0EXE0_9PSEU